MATGGIKIPSTGATTPEYNTVRKSYEEIEPAIIPGDFIRRAHSCGLLPTRNPSSPPLDVVLDEISRDPVNYYSLQHVVGTLNVGDRFDKGIGKMEKTFQLEIERYIPEDPEVDPDNYPKVFISFSRRGDSRSPDAYTEAKGLYDELEAEGCKPWMDEKGLDYGDVLAKEIFQAIKQCDFIIPIMTGGYATSLWCLRELYYAVLQTDPKRPKTIIPMLLEDEDIIDNQKAGKWLLSIGTGQKYFRKEEKDDMIKSLKDKLKESSSAPVPVLTPANSGNPSLPQTEATMHIPLCTTANWDEEDMRSGTVDPNDEAMETDEGHAHGDVLAAWVPKSVLWGKKELAVKFLNNIPAQWTYGGSGMNVGNIMSWANEWSLRGGGTIPKFTWVDEPRAPSDIRIEFTTNGKTETMIGKKATTAKYNQPTMWLDLHLNGTVDDNYKKHLVIHEFGHALGLGHEHQRSDFWTLIKPYVDIAQMKKDLGLTNYPEAFKINWDSDSQFKTGNCTAYDPNSIMHYWFKKQWLKNGYSDQSKVETDRDSGVLPEKVAEALLGVHLRSSIPLADKPSDMDIQLLKDLYGNTSSTILGPPSQPKTLQGGQETPQSPNIGPSSGSTLTQRSGTGGPHVISEDRTVTPPRRFKWCGWPLQLFMMMLVLVAAGLLMKLPFTFTTHPTGDVGAKPFDGEQYSMRLDLTDSIFDKRPDMMKLRHLELPNESSLDIAKRIGDSYKEVGGELLQDSDGIKVKNIHADNFYRIIGTNNDILFEWLQGSGKMPVNWRTLIQVLEKHGKKILAQDIRTALLMNW